MAYKVVIIDDEPIIVEGLKRSIHWEEHHCRVAGWAFGGEDGLDLIFREKPDIIISDICMPGLDGLSMIAAVKSQFPHTEIAILTGYRDFDYAQKAIHLGVTRLLLKPSKMDEIYEALNCMTERLSQKGITGDSAAQESGRSSGLQGAHGAQGITESGQSAEAQDGDSALDSAASSFLVKNALQYIEEHYQEKLRLSDVADSVFVSQWHLSKLLNKHTGKSFSEILNGIRIEKAKELLGDPALRVGDIADVVGFLDIAHFSRVFKKTVGISANDYRNSL